MSVVIWLYHLTVLKICVKILCCRDQGRPTGDLEVGLLEKASSVEAVKRVIMNRVRACEKQGMVVTHMESVLVYLKFCLIDDNLQAMK